MHYLLRNIVLAKKHNNKTKQALAASMRTVKQTVFPIEKIAKWSNERFAIIVWWISGRLFDKLVTLGLYNERD